MVDRWREDIPSIEIILIEILRFIHYSYPGEEKIQYFHLIAAAGRTNFFSFMPRPTLEIERMTQFSYCGLRFGA